ncbi:MAG: hypothetical protein KAK00_00500 [Nanoarchaeota archaeon]|nr:hypothetical protein [Nanoarchaeota archaeon]
MEITIKEKLVAGMTLIVAILAGFGGSEYIDQDILEDTYVCTTNDLISYCPGNPSHINSLSSTAKSCYYVNDVGENKYKRCLNGYFQPITDYAEDRGINPDTLIKEQLNVEAVISEPIDKKVDIGIKHYVCSPQGCVSK